MLKAIQEFFERTIAPVPHETAQAAQHRLQLATAALMLEVARVDGRVEASEQAALRDALMREFALGEGQTETLLALAEREARESSGDYAFTSLVNRGFDAADKLRVVEYMWRIAYADGRLDAHENHFMRKIADLLHIARADYVAAKQRARG